MVEPPGGDSRGKHSSCKRRRLTQRRLRPSQRPVTAGGRCLRAALLPCRRPRSLPRRTPGAPAKSRLTQLLHSYRKDLSNKGKRRFTGLGKWQGLLTCLIAVPCCDCLLHNLRSPREHNRCVWLDKYLFSAYSEDSLKQS